MMSMGKCFEVETKSAPTPTLQVSCLWSGPQYCNPVVSKAELFVPTVFFAKGFGHLVLSMARRPSLVEAVVLCL